MSRRPAFTPRLVPQLPTTRAGAELGLLVAFVGLRVVDLVQLAVAAPGGLDHATRPVLDGVLMVVFVVESVVLMTVLIRARRFSSARLATLDTVLALVILICEPFFTASTDRVGTWTAWGFAVSVGTALGVGIGFPRMWQTVASATALAAAYLVVSLPDTSEGARSSAWSNAVAYFGFALIARAIAGYLRRMGRDADTARAAAEQLGREQEFEAQRRLLHDQATVLHLLSAPEVDARLTAALRGQAALGSRQIRAFLGREASAASRTRRDRDMHRLVAVIADVVSGFGDLPIDCTLDLACGVELPTETAEAMRGALSAVLHNIRVHADARHVTIHADNLDGQWEVTVTDDGVGFDPAMRPAGFGLTHQVTAALAARDVVAEVGSSPGAGTVVILRGTMTVSA